MIERGASSRFRNGAVIALTGLAVVAAIALTWSSMPSSLPKTSVDASGRYRLVDSTGALFDRSRLKGKPYLTYFGYTHCPDICPAMLAKLTAARARIGKNAQDLRIVFITIDPERDTPERLARFVAQSGGDVIALTGSPETIDEVADSAAVYVKRTPQPGGGYMIEHSMSVFIYDRDGDFIDTILPNEDGAAIMDKLRGVLAKPSTFGPVNQSAVS
ncbi:MAG: SCO family protein [Novosphingobium sp.]